MKRLLITIVLCLGTATAGAQQHPLVAEHVAAVQQRDAAIEHAWQLVEQAEAARPMNDAEVASRLTDYGRLCVRQQQLSKEKPITAELYKVLKVRDDQAQAALQRALKMREAIHGKDSAPVAETLAYLALFHVNIGKDNIAEPLLRRTLAIAVPADQNLESTTETLLQLARIEEKTERRAEAISLRLRAIPLQEKLQSPWDIPYVKSLQILGIDYVLSGQPAEAEKYMARALEQYQASPAPDVYHLLNLTNTVIQIQIQNKRYDEAAKMLQRAQELARTLRPENDEVVRTGSLARNMRGAVAAKTN
jgi:tetratricopeptide (TPR) repeat protein